MQRFPDGIDGTGFFQKNTPAHVPNWIERVGVDTAEGGHTEYPVISDAAGLVYFANQGAVVFHTLPARATSPTTIRTSSSPAPSPDGRPRWWSGGSTSPTRSGARGQKPDPWAAIEPPSVTIAEAAQALEA